MNTGVMIWLLIFALSVAVFFLIAAIVAVKGLGNLRVLLRHSKRNDGPPT